MPKKATHKASSVKTGAVKKPPRAKTRVEEEKVNEEENPELNDEGGVSRPAITVGKRFRIIPKKHGFTMYVLNKNGSVYHMFYPSTFTDVVRCLIRYNQKLAILELDKDVTFQEAAKLVLAADKEAKKLVEEFKAIISF